MKIEAHVLAYNESEIIGYALRNLRTFATRIIVHDAGSTDGTRDVCKAYGVEVRPWAIGGTLDDETNMKLKNECWKGTDADWVTVLDCDEFLYFPKGAGATLCTYERLHAAIIKAHGFDMYAEEFPTTEGQIYDEVKMGAPADQWYSKPVLFSPKRVKEINFGIGAHEAEPVLVNNHRLHVGATWPKANPPTYLLHFHHGIGPIDRVAERLDAKRKRLSPLNVKNRWGNLEAGMKHAGDKRRGILAGLMQVVP